MTLARPPAGRGHSAAGWLHRLLHHRRGLRWAAAIGAAVSVFVALGSGGSENRVPIDGPASIARQSSPAHRLAPATRGVPVPADGVEFQTGDVVDVHEIRTGDAIAHAATVVAVQDEHTIVAVPAERVGATVDALTTGGVILVLVPQDPRESDDPALGGASR